MPSPAEVRAARKAAGLTQAQAARIVGMNSRFAWAAYECEGATGYEPEPTRWMLFQLLTDQHPHWRLVRREDKP